MRKCFRLAASLRRSSVLEFYFSFYNNARHSVKRNRLETVRFLQTFSSFKGDSHLQYKENVTSEHVEVQIVNVLHLGQRECASNMLVNHASENSSLNAEHFAYILGYCARIPDPLFAMETWRVMEENTIEINDKCWIFIIQALSRGGYLKEAFGLLHSLWETDRAKIPMYNLYLNRCSRSGDFLEANKCLQLMESHLMGKSEVTYIELLKLAVWQKNLTLVHEIWEEFKKYYEPNIMSLQKFIWSFSKLQDLESACSALRQMVALAVKGNSAGLSARGRYISELDIPIPFNNAFSSKRLSAEEHECSFRNTVDTVNTQAHGINVSNKLGTDSRDSLLPTVSCAAGIRVKKILRWCFSHLMHACAKTGDCDLAEQLFMQMLDLGVEPSSHTFDGFVRVIISKKGIASGVKVVKAMEKRKLKPYSATIAALSIGYSKILELELAEALLDQISDISPKLIHPINALLAAFSAVDKPECAVRLFAKMKSLNIRPNIRTYELLFSLFANVNAPYEEGNISSQAEVGKRVCALEIDMIRNGVDHSNFTLENLMRALGAEGMIDKLLQYFSMTENMFTNAYPGTITYNVVLHALVEARESSTAIEIFKKMLSCGVPLDAATYNIMIDCCSITNHLKSSYALVSLMLRDGFSPAACTYGAIIKILVANEDFHEAARLLEQSFREGFEVDVLMYNSILEEACWKRYLDIVELIIERMHQRTVLPDPSTCSHVFSTYLECGFHNTAMEALQVLSMRMISEDDCTLQEKKAAYEYLVYSEDPGAESWIIEVFNKSNEHLGAALLNLRWCAIAGYDISWSPEESVWAKRLSSSYGSRKGAT